ncbi:MAG: hypothetical protein Fur003_5420 [Candidatus Dojkabacteria bacterium]
MAALKLKWHKLSEKDKEKLRHIKPKVLIMGSIPIEKSQLINLIKAQDPKSIIIIGVMLEPEVPGMEGSLHFRSETLVNLLEKLETFKDSNKLATIEYLAKIHTKYLIRELQPNKVIFINGSWSRVLHYHDEYWEALNAKAQIEMASPFSSEKSAKAYATKTTALEAEALENKWNERLNSSIAIPMEPAEIMKFCTDVSTLSWDWNGRVGAAIVKAGKVISYSHNKVLPYESAMLHEGGIRDKNHIPIGEGLEFYQTNHAEMGCIAKVASSEHSLEECDLYCTLFPCPFCAKVIADTPIKRIYYSGEYTNQMGYEVLKATGKELINAANL